MGANTSYKYFSGAGELLGFLLLLHRRTALLGCFVAIGVMANVCALNWLCGVPVKLYSTHLLLIPVFLLAPFAPRLWALFVSNRFSESVEIRVARSRWLAWPLLALGVLWFVGLIWQGIEGKIAMAESPRIVKMTASPSCSACGRSRRCCSMASKFHSAMPRVGSPWPSMLATPRRPRP